MNYLNHLACRIHLLLSYVSNFECFRHQMVIYQLPLHIMLYLHSIYQLNYHYMVYSLTFQVQRILANHMVLLVIAFDYFHQCKTYSNQNHTVSLHLSDQTTHSPVSYLYVLNHIHYAYIQVHL